MPSQEYEQTIHHIKQHVPQANQTSEEARIAFEELMTGYCAPRSVMCHPHQAGRIPVEWAIPPNPLLDKVILFFHGGGFNVGSSHSHIGLIGALAEKTHMRVLCVNYRLAPKNPFPSALEDAEDCYHWLRTNGYESSNIILAGNSAGANLLLSLMLLLKRKNEPMPHAGICLSPWVDLTLTAESLRTNAQKDFLSPERLKKSAEWYLAGKDPKTPLASPLFGDLTGLPPLLIHVGSDEILLDDARSLAHKAEQQNVEATLEIWEDMAHSWHLFAPKVPESKEALEHVAQWLAKSYATR